MPDLKVKINRKSDKILKADTVIQALIDMSGSMGSIVGGTLEGYNSFINEQRGQEGDAIVSLGLFDSEWERGLYEGQRLRYVKPYTARGIKDVPELTTEVYNPSGGTPLRDAMAQAIRDMDETLKSVEGDPDVIMVIITDGGENTSREHSTDVIKAMVEQRKERGWNFIYMGANQDSWQETQKFGFTQGNVMNYTAEDVRDGAFAKVARATTAYRETSRNLKAQGVIASAYTTDTFFADAGVTEEGEVTFNTNSTEE